MRGFLYELKYMLPIYNLVYQYKINNMLKDEEHVTWLDYIK